MKKYFIHTIIKDHFVISDEPNGVYNGSSWIKNRIVDVIIDNKHHPVVVGNNYHDIKIIHQKEMSLDMLKGLITDYETSPHVEFLLKEKQFEEDIKEIMNG